jgi:hypothetical protein
MKIRTFIKLIAGEFKVLTKLVFIEVKTLILDINGVYNLRIRSLYKNGFNSIKAFKSKWSII